MSKQRLDAADKFHPKDSPFDLSEIKTEGVEIEVVGGAEDLRKLTADEAFMNEPVTIRVHEDTREGELEIITPNVNGINQPIVRGIEQTVKRKYVEALARSFQTTYRQDTPNKMEPDRINMVPKTALSYPFEMIRDPNPRGRAWLNALLAQAI